MKIEHLTFVFEIFPPRAFSIYSRSSFCIRGWSAGELNTKQNHNQDMIAVMTAGT